MLGVALAPNGDCWATGMNYASSESGGPALAYFAHCQGRGVIASGFQNPKYLRGIDIDDSGNLVVISCGNSAALYIYSGCNPACTLVGGPFKLLAHYSYYGHLDARSKRFVAANYQKAQLDVYSYSTSGIKYEYSINNGLSRPDGVVGAAFSPPSKE
jgi:hypothetical protein